MKAAIVLVLALVAASQARSVVPAGIFNELTKEFPSMKCALEHMRNVIDEELCFNVFSKKCQDKEAAVVNEIVDKCFAEELKEFAKTGADSRDAADAMKMLGCFMGDSWSMLTGQAQNPLEIFNCFNA